MAQHTCPSMWGLVVLLCLLVGPAWAQQNPHCDYYKKTRELACSGFTGQVADEFSYYGASMIEFKKYQIQLEKAVADYPTTMTGCAYSPRLIPIWDSSRKHFRRFVARFSFQIDYKKKSPNSGFAFVFGRNLRGCGDDSVGYSGYSMSPSSMAIVFKHSPNPCLAFIWGNGYVGDNCERAPFQRVLPAKTFAHNKPMHVTIQFLGNIGQFRVFLSKTPKMPKTPIFTARGNIWWPAVQVGFTGATTTNCETTCVNADAQRILSLDFKGGRSW